MQARNLLPPVAAAPVDDDDVAGAELLVVDDPDDPQAAATRAITPRSAINRICALKMYLLCPGAPLVPGWRPAPALAPAG
jgi:hypothetical protein